VSAHRPRVLVVVASKHGSTAEIGTALAGDLDDSVAGRAAGLFAVSMPVEQPPNGPGLGRRARGRTGSCAHGPRAAEPAARPRCRAQQDLSTSSTGRRPLTVPVEAG
jgi:hypothetical protein